MGLSLRDPFGGMVAFTFLGSERFVQWVKERWIKKRGVDRDLPALGSFPRDRIF